MTKSSERDNMCTLLQITLNTTLKFVSGHGYIFHAIFSLYLEIEHLYMRSPPPSFRKKKNESH